MKRNLICAGMVLAMFLTAAGPVLGRDTVGYVDLKRLLVESKVGQLAAEDVNKWGRQRNAELAERYTKLREEQAGIEAQAASWPVEKAKAKMEEFYKKKKAFEREVEDVKEDLARREQELMVQILAQGEVAVKKVAERRGYSVILLDPKVVGYVSPKVNITAEVVAELDKNY